MNSKPDKLICTGKCKRHFNKILFALIYSNLLPNDLNRFMVLFTLFVFEDPLFVLFSLDDTCSVVLITFVENKNVY